MKRLKSLNGVTPLNRDQQRTIFGGDGGDQFSHAPIHDGGGGGSEGPCTVLCASGNTVSNAPDCQVATQDAACSNQQGSTGTCYGNSHACDLIT